MGQLGPIERSGEFDQILAPALKPGEQLIWCGQPSSLVASLPTRLATWMGGALTGFFLALRLVGGAELPLWPSLAAGAVVVMVATGVAHVAMGAMLAAVRRRTVYGLTADAAIIHQGLPTARTVLIDLTALAHVDLTLGRQDIGTITFGRGPDAPAFRAVRHARHVFDLVRRKEQTP